MQIDPLTIVAGVGVASLLIERVYYYRSLYKKECNTPNNPSASVDYHQHGERIASMETEIENMKDSNNKDHELIRKDVRKIFTLLNGLRK